MSAQPTLDDLIDPVLRQEGPTGPLHMPNGHPGLNSSLSPSTTLPHSSFSAEDPFKTVSSTSDALLATQTSSATPSTTPAFGNTPAARDPSAAPCRTSSFPNDGSSTLDNAPTASTNASALGKSTRPPTVGLGASGDAHGSTISPSTNGAVAAGTPTDIPQGRTLPTLFTAIIEIYFMSSRSVSS